MPEVPKEYGFQAAEEKRPTEEGPYAAQRAKLALILDANKARAEERERQRQEQADRDERRKQWQESLPAIPSAADIAARRVAQLQEREPIEEEERDEVLVSLESGEVTFVKSTELDLTVFVEVITPELVEYVESAGTDHEVRFEVLSGRFIHSWRQRRPEDGTRRSVPGLPKPKEVKNERVELGQSFGDWRNTVHLYGGKDGQNAQTIQPGSRWLRSSFRLASRNEGAFDPHS